MNTPGPSPGGRARSRRRTDPIDLDATIVISHSDKENAAPTRKKTFGFHPMTAFADHGTDGAGEPLALVLRAGNAGSNTAADHINATVLALAQLPRTRRRQTLIRTDSGGGTHEFLTWLTRPGRWLKYSIGFTITDDIGTAILRLPTDEWTPGYDAEGQVRPGTWVTEITGLANLTSGAWNPPHPARQPGHHADQEAKSRLSQMPQPTTRRSRKIEARIPVLPAVLPATTTRSHRRMVEAESRRAGEPERRWR